MTAACAGARAPVAAAQRAVWVPYRSAMTNSTFGSDWFERALGVPTTVRNRTTLERMRAAAEPD